MEQNMVKPLKNLREGFSLVDVMVAMCIMMFGLIFFLQFSLSSYMCSRESKCRHVATLYAEQLLTDLTLKSYVTSGNSNDTIINSVQLKKSWTVVDGNNVKNVNVNIQYKRFRGNWGSVTLAGVAR
jgi:Tfp pilus assembly protein PilV